MSVSSSRAIGGGLTLRGLWHRRWLSLVVLCVAAIAAAAAAMGPTYAGTARTAILRDAFAEAPPGGRGVMVIYEPRLEPPEDLPETREATGIQHAFGSPIMSAELASPVLGEPNAVKLIWRDGVCLRLQLLSGRCPSGPGEVVASRATSTRYGWTVGGRALLEDLVPPRPLRGTPDGDTPVERGHPLPLTVVGIYEPRDPGEAYWFGLPYFPDSMGRAEYLPEGQRLFDPLFTDQATLEWARPAAAPWSYSVTLFVDPPGLTGDDAEGLRMAPQRLRDRAIRQVGLAPATVLSAMEATASRAIRDMGALGVPVALVTLELVALCWLVLFLAVADLVQARRLEIGLARLRGLSRGQVWRFGLGEPVVLLLAALPVGLLAARPIATSLSRAVLAPDIRVEIGWMAWVTATGAIVGGLLAAGLAARATLTTPVTEQWRRSRSHLGRRSWVPEAIVLALVAAGLVELTSGGLVTNPSRQHATGLLVPALLGVGVALVAARALPYACRAAFGLTRRRGGIGAFLALRQIARAPGTANAVIVLAVSFALATFAVSVWSITSQNHGEVARTHNGAPTVLEVAPPEGSSLPELVARADPGGRSAAAVAIHDRGADLLAVDTARVAHVAYWRSDFAAAPLSELLRRLRSAVAPRIPLSGEHIRVTVDSRRVADPAFSLLVDVEVPDRTGRVTLPLGRSDSESAVLAGRLSLACRQSCELRGFTVDSSDEGPAGAALAELLIRKVEVRSGGRWQALDAGLTESWRWRAESSSPGVRPETAGTPEGLKLTFLTGAETRAVAAIHPATLPAITVGRIEPEPRGSMVFGLDGLGLQVTAIARARAAPGATGPTALVDYELADRAAFGVSNQVRYQVWVAPGAAARITQALQEQGVAVTGERAVEDLVRRFNRQGPGLALALLLAAAAAAVTLAMARAVLGLWVAGRRRTYELAALAAVGVSPGAQRRALLIEQALTLGFGALVGVLAGVAAAGIATPTVPQFTIQPSTPPLTLVPDPLVLGGAPAAAALAVAIAAVLTTEAIRRSVRVEQLREAPP
ncbi:MAG: FtsX-like permease family protein [Actinomycetota bacterium]